MSTGDTFGENSFNENNPITPHTIITNRRTELIMVTPSDIETYLSKLHENEKEDITNFINNWWLTKYWNWSEENKSNFVKFSQFLRYSDNEIIIDNSTESLSSSSSFDKIYFILKGHVQLVRLFHINKSNNSSDIQKKLIKKTKQEKKLIRVCLFEKDNYFGLADQSSTSSWYLAMGDTDLIAIDKQKFLSIHKHAYFLFSQLQEDFKLAVPSGDKEINSYLEAFLISQLASHIRFQ